MALAAYWVLFGLAMMPILFARAEDTVFNGESLLTNQFIENGPYKFIMQGDCNLVLYKDNKAIWASNTAGHGGSCFVVLQNNGNLVMFSGSDVIWSSSSSRGPNNYRLVVQSDGNVVIYGGATWSTNTAQGSKRTKVHVVDPLLKN